MTDTKVIVTRPILFDRGKAIQEHLLSINEAITGPDGLVKPEINKGVIDLVPFEITLTAHERFTNESAGKVVNELREAFWCNSSFRRISATEITYTLAIALRS